MSCSGPSAPAKEGCSLQQSAHEYQHLLSTGQLSSVTLVNSFLDQIARHNHSGLKLNAVLSVCPRDAAIAQAQWLDQERGQGRIRGSLHGIPIIIKDAIVTDQSLGMVTSAGSSAVASLRAKRNATLVDRIIEAGAIVLGKGNLTEFCGLKSDNTPIGWSAYGGQTFSPYRRDSLRDEHQPWCGGSSAGPAVSVAAGFAPLGIGTETGGSNVFPASVNGLYGLTLPHGTVPMDGIFRISETFDRVGLMARHPRDLVSLCNIMLKADAKPQELSIEGAIPVRSLWEGLSIGVLDSEWGTDPTSRWKWGSAEVKDKYASVVNKMEELGARVIFPLENPPSPDMLMHEDHEFEGCLKDFISLNFEPDPNLTNLTDLVTWNEEHAAAAMPKPYATQTELVKCRDDTMTPERHDMAAAKLRSLAKESGMAKMMRERGIDIIISASDASLISFSSCAGWPVATVPIGNLSKNGQPWGFFVLARDGSIDLLLKFLKAFHGCFEVVMGPVSPFE
ncbi:hypothetical protein VPNG_09964 [Cytospora leucostoma]|uniref:Amidase domain-containing protein n=1 Tax=Cytospora leucostoma TaxID=1230097 RepID=A0A423VL31_9PEZI|nr:hypothetical protein VPNG_09964 [Cytospora leucostoma]